MFLFHIIVIFETWSHRWYFSFFPQVQFLAKCVSMQNCTHYFFILQIFVPFLMNCGKFDSTWQYGRWLYFSTINITDFFFQGHRLTNIGMLDLNWDNISKKQLINFIENERSEKKVVSTSLSQMKPLHQTSCNMRCVKRAHRKKCAFSPMQRRFCIFSELALNCRHVNALVIFRQCFINPFQAYFLTCAWFSGKR